MVATRHNLIRHLPTGGAACVGIVTAALFLLVPAETLEGWVWSSGIAALVPAAAPPLGGTARGVLALGGGAIAAAVTWAALFLLWGPDGFLASPPAPRQDGAPVVRRADAHPDAPPRRPLSAADLGVPPAPRHDPPPSDLTMPSELAPTPPAERTLPADLDQPLAAFDPEAIPPVPMAPVRPVASLTPPPVVAPVPEPQPTRQPTPTPVDRIETFELTPMVRKPAPAPSPAPPQTIEALLKRLEQGTRRPGKPV